ncbi:stabilizer of axonemal microtubules 5 isoform X2 [Macrotis lagotis]|uniref:stabilizer of axonemal microtubules 5 isoform X2 n=1 Tax=Macrotis lagotis TaxID=92651 RepID=UPI003D696B0F
MSAGLFCETRMAERPSNLLPSPLPRLEFLKSSHFKIGPDPRLLKGSMKTTFGIGFPAHSNTSTASPFMPGPSKGLFHEDLEKIREINSETHAAFPVHNVHSSPSSINLMMQISNLKMHGDSRINVFQTTSQEMHPYPGREALNPFTKEAQRKFDKDSFPSGDKDKLGIPLSHNREVFVPHQQFSLHRAPSLHLGGPSPLKWGMEPFPDTSYQEKFQGKSTFPSQICEKVVSYLQLGDSKTGLEGLRSEQKTFYTPQDLPQQRYNKKEAVANIFQVNIKPGDDHFHAYLPGYKDEAPMDTPEVVFKQQAITDSLLLKGDQDPERCRERSNFTTNHHYFNWKPEKDFVKPEFAMKSHVILGEKNPKTSNMVTTHQQNFSYPTPTPASTGIVKSRYFLQSNFKLGTNEMDFLTSSRQLGPHSVKKNPVPEEIKQRVKYTHILPPHDDMEFSTEYKDQYPYKYVGPVVLKEDNFQESSVPLNLPEKQWSGKKVVIPC